MNSNDSNQTNHTVETGYHNDRNPSWSPDVSWKHDVKHGHDHCFELDNRCILPDRIQKEVSKW